MLTGIYLSGCSTPYCPDSGTGLGNTCGQVAATNATSATNSSGVTTNTTTTGNTTATNTGNPVANTTNSTVTNVTRNAFQQSQMFLSSPSAGLARLTLGQTSWNPTSLLGGPPSAGYLTLDALHDRLYVADTGANAIEIYDAVSTLGVNASPIRVLTGASTGLNAPVQVQVDDANDLLYVGNSGSTAITVFSSASTVSGDVTPARTMVSPHISGISSIYLDSAGNRLWVVDPRAEALVEFDSAATLTGSSAATRVVSGSNTALVNPRYLTQGGTSLYVSVTSAILRFSSADSLMGNVAPAAGLAGVLRTPGQLTYSTSTNELYVADPGANAVLVFANASTTNGIPGPANELGGRSTGLPSVAGLALELDPQGARTR